MASSKGKVPDAVMRTPSAHSKDNFFQLVTQFPQIGVEVMHELASRLHNTTKELTAARARLKELEPATGDSGG